LTSYTITGDCNDACAKPKATLEADNAKFNANLAAQFKSPLMPPRKPVAAAFAAGPHSSAGSALSTNRNRDDSLRGRLRTTLRVSSSR